jgi:hypothetical protein
VSKDNKYLFAIGYEVSYAAGGGMMDVLILKLDIFTDSLNPAVVWAKSNGHDLNDGELDRIAMAKSPDDLSIVSGFWGVSSSSPSGDILIVKYAAADGAVGW